MNSGQTRLVGFRPWRVAAVAALLGWLLVTLFLVIGARPLGWVVSGAAVVTLSAAMLHARARRLRLFEAAAFALACIVLSWPVLGLVTLLIFSWAGVAHWE